MKKKRFQRVVKYEKEGTWIMFICSVIIILFVIFGFLIIGKKSFFDFGSVIEAYYWGLFSGFSCLALYVWGVQLRPKGKKVYFEEVKK